MTTPSSHSAPTGQRDRTDVQGLAAWAYRASYDKLSADSVREAPTHILDALGCCIAALGAGPTSAVRSVIQDQAGSGPVPLLGGGTSSLTYAAMWHTATVRYVDFMDNFLAARETCHTADNFGAVFTAALQAKASGKEFVTALAVAYTAQSRYVDHGTFMQRGLDHTAQLGFSIPAGVGPLLGLTEAQTAHAASIAAVSDSSYAIIRAKPLSQWKGLASSQSALGAINAVLLAKAGVEGPLRVVEGVNGIDHLLGTKIDIDWDTEGYEGIATSTIKSYNSEIHTQSSIDCMLGLRKKQQINPDDVDSIEAETTQITYDFTGGGAYGNATDGIDSKEQADHSLPYLMAVALIDGAVGPDQFTPQRVQKQDVQQLLQKVTVKPVDDFTKRYPSHMPARMTVHLTNGGTVSSEVQDFVGMPVNPMPWDGEVDKFGQLVAGRIPDSLRDDMVSAVKAIDSTSVQDLWRLLADVPTPSDG